MRKIRFYGEIIVSESQFPEMKERIETQMIKSIHSVMGKESPKLAEKIAIVVKNLGEVPIKIKVSSTEAQDFEKLVRLENKNSKKKAS